MTNVYSSSAQLDQIASILINYSRLPISDDAIPGAFLEGVLAHVRQAERLNTYDYIDIVDRKNRVGWSIKSTKESTPVTWKRAKIPNQQELIIDSRNNEKGLQKLGDSLIEFCNGHAAESFSKYNLKEIGYSRIILMKNRNVIFFEKVLATENQKNIFCKEDFVWSWSKQKKTRKKEQLQALHGHNVKTDRKWWAWHGLGENQLHFSGEKDWWPNEGSDHTITFSLPDEEEKISFGNLALLLSKI